MHLSTLSLFPLLSLLVNPWTFRELYMGITLNSTELLATARTSPDPGSLVKNWHAARLLSGSSLTAVFGYLEHSFWQRAEANHLISCAVLWLLWFWTICLLPLCEGNVVRRVWKIIYWFFASAGITLPMQYICSRFSC